ncbi:hypothetical protein P3S67_015106 [Capsicum chacoense]
METIPVSWPSSRLITSSIPPYCNPEAQWVNRVRNDASGGAVWNELLNLTIEEIGQFHQDFDTPIGILILLGSAVVRAGESSCNTGRQVCFEDVGNEMISGEYFKETWTFWPYS